MFELHRVTLFTLKHEEWMSTKEFSVFFLFPIFGLSRNTTIDGTLNSTFPKKTYEL